MLAGKYAYDSRGNITQEISAVAESSYSYDALNRLTRVDSISEDKTYIYTYDAGGNITSKKIYDYCVPGVDINTQTPLQTITYTYGDTNWKDKLTAYNGKTITYDEIGNPLTYDGKSFSWLGRRLMTYNSGSAVTNYTYNADGIRTTKTVGGTKTEFFLNGSTVLAQKTGSTVMPFYYDANGTRIAFKYNGTMYYYVYNLQGDVTHIMKSDGSIVGTYEYDAWGKITNLSSLTTIAGVNPFRYRGYYYDNESGLYYLNSRYYNPEWGRFINADGIIGETGNIHSYNLYAYCFDNPVLLTDSDGYCPYNGTAADFHRMEQGLPSLDCICSSNNLLVFNKINPNDYDDDSLYENNSQLRGRDAKRREKKQISDAFGNDRSQREQKSRDLHDSKKGKRNDNNVPFGKLKNGDVWDIAVLTGCGIAVVWIIVNDSTGIGVADDVLLSAFIPIIKEVLV